MSFTAAAAFTSYVKSHCFCPKDLLTQWPDFITRKLGRAAKAAQNNTENQYRDYGIVQNPFKRKIQPLIISFLVRVTYMNYYLCKFWENM